MTLLTKGPALIVQPDLALLMGQDEAMLLQQLHYRLTHQGVEREGKKWFFHSYESWRKQIPFWSISKLKSKFLKLEKMGLVISTDKFNQFYVDRTKWYCIDYDKLDAFFSAHAISSNPTEVTAQTLPGSQEKRCEQVNVSHSDTKEVVRDSNNTIYSAQIDQIIECLNEQAHKNFTVYNHSNRRDIQDRLKEGYSVEDCLDVIKEQVSQWKDDVFMARYLRPSTLFKRANFENYLNAARASAQNYYVPKLVVLDFNAGEDW